MSRFGYFFFIIFIIVLIPQKYWLPFLFSDKSRFGYFFRVVPSDYFQAKVLPKKHWKWFGIELFCWLFNNKKTKYLISYLTSFRFLSTWFFEPAGIMSLLSTRRVNFYMAAKQCFQIMQGHCKLLITSKAMILKIIHFSIQWQIIIYDDVWWYLVMYNFRITQMSWLLCQFANLVAFDLINQDAKAIFWTETTLHFINQLKVNLLP